MVALPGRTASVNEWEKFAAAVKSELSAMAQNLGGRQVVVDSVQALQSSCWGLEAVFHAEPGGRTHFDRIEDVVSFAETNGLTGSEELAAAWMVDLDEAALG